MASVLLDTDVFSYIFKSDTWAELYRPYFVNAQICISFQTVAELRRWTLTRKWGGQRIRKLDESFGQCIVLPYDDLMSHQWALVMATRHSIGRPIECGDAWIAAAALRFGMTLISHNASDFRGIPNLNVISLA